MKRVFISHSVKDAERAKELVERLEHDSGLKPEEIFFSSMFETGIKEAKPFCQEIADAFKESAICVYLMSDAFLSSGNCIIELGWALLTGGEKKLYIVELGEGLSVPVPSMVSHINRNRWSEQLLGQIAQEAWKTRPNRITMEDIEKAFGKKTEPAPPSADAPLAPIQTGDHSPVTLLGDNARVGDIRIGDEYHTHANPTPSPSDVILGEYEAKQRALLEKGGLPILDLTWHEVRPAQTALVKRLNALAPNRVMHAYMSEERVFQYGGPVYRHYIVETAHSGYVKQECAGRQMGSAFSDNVWPFYFITCNESAETVEEMSPHRAVCHYREIDDNMRKAEELYNSVKAKVGSPFNLL